MYEGNYKDGELISKKEWDKDKVWKNTSTYKNLSRKYKTPKGIELHHWRYKDGFLDDVVLMTTKDHKHLHKYQEQIVV